MGKTLTQTQAPDEVKVLLVERDFLPKGHYREVGFQKRQVVDIDIRKIITEYQAQILENEQDERFVDEFPEGVNIPIQYGVGVYPSYLKVNLKEKHNHFVFLELVISLSLCLLLLSTVGKCLLALKNVGFYLI